MEAFFPIDQSYFRITFEGDKGNVNVSKNVISFSVTEEIQKMTNGSITLRDPQNIYSRQLKNGKTFSLEWGYKKQTIDFSLAKEKNPSEITGGSVRTNLKGYIQSPGGGGANNGELTYNCNFYGAEMQSNLKDTIWHRAGTKKQVIQSIMGTLGAANTFIDFEQQFEQLGENNAVLQNETPFRFLNRLAFEWRCVFKLGYTVSGNLIGLFIDNNKIDGSLSQNFQKLVNGGTTGSTKLFEYGIGSLYPNVIAYTWKHNIGDSGYGDGNKIEIINGKTVITNYTVENETVKISKLNEGRLREYIKNNPEQKDLLKDIVAANSLQSKIGDTTVGHFFDDPETKTAPQGLGYSVSLQVIGDPLFTCPMKATMGNGFPDMFKNDVGGLNKFFIKKVTHTINASGYKCSLEIADVITTFGGFVT
jgi:hypothetical protein